MRNELSSENRAKTALNRNPSCKLLIAGGIRSAAAEEGIRFSAFSQSLLIQLDAVIY